MFSRINELEKLSEVDLEGALQACREEVENNQDNLWLRLLLVKLHEKNESLDLAKNVATFVYEQDKTFTAVWPYILKYNYGSEKYLIICSEIYADLKNGYTFEHLWLKRLFVEVLFSSGNRSLTLNNILELSLFSDNLSSRQIYGAYYFLCLLDIKLANINKYSSWSFTVCSDGEIAFISNDTLWINLFYFEIDSLHALNGYISDLILRAIFPRMSFRPYFDDFGISNWGYRSALAERYAHLRLWYLFNVRVRSMKEISRDVKEIATVEFKENELYVRTGTVEISAIANYYKNTNKGNLIIEELAIYLSSNCESVAEIGTTNIGWFPNDDFRSSLVKLMTNAGWYSSLGYGERAFKRFAEGYLSAINFGNVFTTCIDDFSSIGERMQINPNNLCVWSTDNYLKFLNNKNILLISPYATIIQERFNSGLLQKFFDENNLDIEISSLHTVQSPMTIYPYSDKFSYAEKLDELIKHASVVIESHQIDLIISSCGCYGLPFSYEIWNKYAKSTIYYGHVIHMYFGIFSNAFIDYDFYLQSKSDKWIRSDLGNLFPSIKNIDSGRYIS